MGRPRVPPPPPDCSALAREVARAISYVAGKCCKISDPLFPRLLERAAVLMVEKAGWMKWRKKAACPASLTLTEAFLSGLNMRGKKA